MQRQLFIITFHELRKCLNSTFYFSFLKADGTPLLISMDFCYVYVYLNSPFFLATIKTLCGHRDRDAVSRCIKDKRIIRNTPSCFSFEISKQLQCSRSSSWIHLGVNLGLPKVKEMAFKTLLGLSAIIITEAADGPHFSLAT